MTLPDFLKLNQGTAIVWGVPSAVLMGLTVTKDMSIDALASGSGRNGVYADLGADFEQEYAVFILAETGTAPTAGNVVEVFFATSPVTSAFPGKATGTDAVYSSTPSVASNKLQIGGVPFILTATADTNTELIQYAGIFTPPCRYVAPVYINSLGQALRDEATASNNTSGIILVPRLYTQVE